MPIPRATVRVNLRPLRQLTAALGGAKSSPMKRALKTVASKYLTYSRKRYHALARGGSYNGDRWQPLAESTKKARARKATRQGYKGPRKFSILIDTSLLLNGLTINAPGNVYRIRGDHVEVGLGAGTHPGSDGITIGELAGVHQFGNPPHLPARPILALPDRQTSDSILETFARAELRLLKMFSLR